MTDSQAKGLLVLILGAILVAIAVFAFVVPTVGTPLLISILTLGVGCYVGDNMRLEGGFAFFLLIVLAIALTVIASAPFALAMGGVAVAGLASGIVIGKVS